MTSDRSPKTTQVTSDVERWSTAVYALWSEHTGGHWQLVGGHFMDADSVRNDRFLLERDWGIHDLREGMAQIELLIDKRLHHSPAVDGWDYCRAMQLVGLFYTAEFIDRPQMIDLICKVGTAIQQQFHSWDELCRSYLAGYEQWCGQQLDAKTADNYIKYRQEHYERLCKLEDGPYKLPFHMKLVPPQEAFPGFYRQWTAQEEARFDRYNQKIRRQARLIVVPSTLAVLAAFMWVLALMNGIRGAKMMGVVVVGTAIAGIPLALFYLFLSWRLHHNHITAAIEKTVQTLKLSPSEREALGADMLDALLDPQRQIHYLHGAHRQKIPGRVLIGKHYFYQVGATPQVVLVQRSNLDHIGYGTELTTHAGRTAPLYTIRFYYRSSREARLEGNDRADASMGFYDLTIRDKAYWMMGGTGEA